MLQLCHIAAVLLLTQPGAGLPAPAQSSAQPGGQALVMRALDNELRSARDPRHPMHYRLRKSSPRLTQTKDIYETRDGGVARLISVNDQPLSGEDEAREVERLNELLADPSKQQRRKQNEEQDAGRVLKVLRAMPKAFLYEYVGTGSGPAGAVEHYSFRPNPGYDPTDMQTQALASMGGDIWIDAAHERVTRLEGHLVNDVDYGWGLLGRLYKGGWIVVEQAPISGNQWRIVRFQMDIEGRVLFSTKSFQTVEQTYDYAPLPVGLGYAQAIKLMRNGRPGTSMGGQ